MAVYPEALVPQDVWEHEIAIEDILKINEDALLGRWVKGGKQQCVDYSLGEDMPVLKEGSIDIARMLNISCSLLGALFLPVHFCFVAKGQGSIPWKNTEYASIPQEMRSEENYMINEDFFVIAWRINDVNLMPVPYSQTFAKEDVYGEFKKKSDLIAEKRSDDKEHRVLAEWNELKKNNNGAFETEVYSQLRVHHDPTTLNYWHFLIDAFPADDDEQAVMARKNAWQKSLTLNIWNILSKSFVVIDDETDIPQLDSSIWLPTTA